MKEIAASITPICLFMAISLPIVSYFMVERFFKALLLSQPELADAFKRQSLLIILRPNFCRKISLLERQTICVARRPRVARKGNQAYLALAAYAVSSLIFLLVILTWAASRGP